MRNTGLFRSSMAWGRATALACACVGALAVSAQAQQTQPFSTPNIYGFGDPLDAIKVEALFGATGDLQTFGEGQATFIEVDGLPQLGPLFNSRSCGTCHFQPALGGTGSFINEIRVRNNPRPGPVQIFASDNILRAGPQSQGNLVVFPNGLEASPLGCQSATASIKPKPNSPVDWRSAEQFAPLANALLVGSQILSVVAQFVWLASSSWHTERLHFGDVI